MRYFILATGLVLLASTPSAAQDVDGTWVFSVNSPDGVVQMQIDLEQSGDELTGAVRLDMAESAEISDVALKDNTLRFLLHVGIQGEVFSVQITATIDGDEMIGEASLADVGTMPFTAERAGVG